MNTLGFVSDDSVTVEFPMAFSFCLLWEKGFVQAMTHFGGVSCRCLLRENNFRTAIEHDLFPACQFYCQMLLGIVPWTKETADTAADLGSSFILLAVLYCALLCFVVVKLQFSEYKFQFCFPRRRIYRNNVNVVR